MVTGAPDAAPDRQEKARHSGVYRPGDGFLAVSGLVLWVYVALRGLVRFVRALFG